MSFPLAPLLRRFEMSAIKDGVSCLWCQKQDSWRADSRPPVLEQFASNAWRNSAPQIHTVNENERNKKRLM